VGLLYINGEERNDDREIDQATQYRSRGKVSRSPKIKEAPNPTNTPKTTHTRYPVLFMPILLP
jgi:hypothetical protein